MKNFLLIFFSNFSQPKRLFWKMYTVITGATKVFCLKNFNSIIFWSKTTIFPKTKFLSRKSQLVMTATIKTFLFNVKQRKAQGLQTLWSKMCLHFDYTSGHVKCSFDNMTQIFCSKSEKSWISVLSDFFSPTARKKLHFSNVFQRKFFWLKIFL